MHRAWIGVTLAAALTLAPVGGAADERHEPQQAPASQEVSDRELEQYVQALRAIAAWQARVAATLRRGEPLDLRLLKEASRQEQLRGLQDVERAGLTGGRFVELTQRISQEAQLRQRYYQRLLSLRAGARWG